MEFKPCSEQELIDRKLWKKGEYAFEVLDASEKTSKAGHPMIELKHRVSDSKGGVRTLFDYLLAEAPEKLRHASAVCGLLDKYLTGKLSAADFRGKRGKLKLVIEKGKGGFQDKNAVADYVGVRA